MQFSLKGNYISLETSKWFGKKCSTVLCCNNLRWKISFYYSWLTLKTYWFRYIDGRINEKQVLVNAAKLKSMTCRHSRQTSLHPLNISLGILLADFTAFGK